MGPVPLSVLQALMQGRQPMGAPEPPLDPMQPHPLLAQMNDPRSGIMAGPGGGLPSPPGSEAEEDEFGIDPTTGQPTTGWNKAHSVAGPAAGLIGLLALAGGHRNLASGLMGFGQAAQGGWDRKMRRAEDEFMARQRKDIERAHQIYDELREVDVNAPEFKEVQDLKRSFETKLSSGKGLSSGEAKNWLVAYGRIAALLPKAREAQKAGELQRQAKLQFETEQKQKEQAELIAVARDMNLPPNHPAVGEEVRRRRLQLQKIQDEELRINVGAPTKREQHEADERARRAQQSLGWAGIGMEKARLEESRQYHKDVGARAAARDAAKKELRLYTEFRKVGAAVNEAIARQTALGYNEDLLDAMQSDDPVEKQVAMNEIIKRGRIAAQGMGSYPGMAGPGLAAPPNGGQMNPYR